jgi:hypothetical protein
MSTKKTFTIVILDEQDESVGGFRFQAANRKEMAKALLEATQGLPKLMEQAGLFKASPNDNQGGSLQ